jgi:lysophospholipase L1-like esterase
MRSRIASVPPFMCLFGGKAASLDATIAVRSILCYGDSLTAGYCKHGTEFNPYGNTLAAKSGLPVTTVGMSGWTTQQMVQAAAKQNVEDPVGHSGDGIVTILQKRQYDLVCLMAGTNDLINSFNTGDILVNIETLVNYCLHANKTTRIVLLTVPASGAELTHEAARKRRMVVNHGLVKIASKYSYRVMLIDTADALPNPGHRDSPAADLWDLDMLRFSAYGSERLGEFVYSTLVERGVLTSYVPNIIA